MCANLSQPSGLEGKIGLKIAYIRLHFTDVSAESYFFKSEKWGYLNFSGQVNLTTENQTIVDTMLYH